MHEKIPHILNIFDAHNKRDLPEQLRQFETLTSALFKLTQSLFESGEKPPYFQAELENKYFRFGIANHSILNLARGNEFKILDKAVNMRDVFALFSLTRMQIESFTLMYYLFFDDKPENEMNFRYDVYKLHGLEKQHQFKVSSEYGKALKQKIKGEIDVTQKRIQENSIFIGSKPKDQKEFLNPRFAKLITTYDIIEKTGLKSQRFDEMWNLYSNHAHGEHISDRQFNAIYKRKKSTDDEASTTITLCGILTAKLCEYLKTTFEGANVYYKGLDLEIKVQIETWCKLGT